jgi:type I restriction enzyme, S subunit
MDLKSMKLNDLASFSQGFQVPIEKQLIQSQTNTVRFLRIVDYTKDGYEEPRYIINPGRKYIVNNDDLVMIRYGSKTAGRVVRGLNGAIANNMFRIVITSEEHVNKSYLFLFLSQGDLYRFLNKSQSSSTMPAITFEMIGKIEIPLPDIYNQHKIVAIITAYDDLIENNLRRIKILEEMAQNLYREWFVNFRFPGHEQTRFIDSPLGRIPEGWEVGDLKDTCNLVMGQSPKSEFYNDICLGLPFHQGVTNFGSRFPVTKHYCTDTKRIAQKNDILFSVRAPVGRINIADTRLVTGRGLSAISHKKNWQWFLYHYLRDVFKEEDIIGGGTIYQSVTKKDMEDIKILNPRHDTVDYFESIVIPINNLIEALDKKNNSLRQTRDLLLPKLISGEVDVSELDIKVPEEVAS